MAKFTMDLVNFGRFTTLSRTLESDARYWEKNGSGKTTLVNAYIFAITGRTINGFEPRRIDAPSDEDTHVIIRGLFGKDVRRTLLASGGTKLYVGGDVVTQKAFSEAINVPLLEAFANTNLLCDGSVDSEQLRKLLCVTGIMDSDERVTVEKRIKATRDLLKQAEARAVSVVAVPPTTKEPLNASEERFLQEYHKHAKIASTPLTYECPTCGARYSEERINKMERDFRNSDNFLFANVDEIERVKSKLKAFEEEQLAIADAKRLVELSTQARNDVTTYRKQLDDLEAELREIDANAIRAELPDGVTIETTKLGKTGASKSVCTLCYDGVPLKSINRAKRVTICIELLIAARKRANLESFPIWVDNAECVQDLDRYDNLIAFSVPQ
jgi:hypothetical protein